MHGGSPVAARWVAPSGPPPAGVMFTCQCPLLQLLLGRAEVQELRQQLVEQEEAGEKLRVCRYCLHTRLCYPLARLCIAGRWVCLLGWGAPANHRTFPPALNAPCPLSVPLPTCAGAARGPQRRRGAPAAADGGRGQRGGAAGAAAAGSAGARGGAGGGGRRGAAAGRGERGGACVVVVWAAGG